ncbi:type VII secretion integral membrane protein EccD [Nocardioides salsibiostraticola]
MTQVAAGASGLIRVTVTSGSRRVDLVLPGAVPVAELVPELARSVGLLDPGTVYAGYRVVTSEGRQLADDSGLTMQGVEDGGLLTVSAGVDDTPERIYDDVVEAMTDVVENDLKPWEPAAGRRTALVAASLLMSLGAVALLIQRDAPLAAAAAAVVSAALAAGAIVLSRAQGEAEAAVAVAWMSAGYAAVAGLLFAPGTELSFGLPSAYAGGGALISGLICLIGLGRSKALVLPPALVGAILLGAGLLSNGFDLAPAQVLVVALAFVVIVGSVFPWLALGMTGTSVEQLFTPADITADPAPIDPDRVAADALVAHEILLAISGTVGLLLVVVAPLAVGLGITGLALAVVASLIVMLRTRQYRTGSEVLIGLTSGVLGVAAVAVAVLFFREEWHGPAAVLLAGTGATLMAVTLVPSPPSVRRGRLGDVVETAALLSLLPLLVASLGLV